MRHLILAALALSLPLGIDACSSTMFLPQEDKVVVQSIGATQATYDLPDGEYRVQWNAETGALEITRLKQRGLPTEIFDTAIKIGVGIVSVLIGFF